MWIFRGWVDFSWNLHLGSNFKMLKNLSQKCSTHNSKQIYLHYQKKKRLTIIWRFYSAEIILKVYPAIALQLFNSILLWSRLILIHLFWHNVDFPGLVVDAVVGVRDIGDVVGDGRFLCHHLQVVQGIPGGVGFSLGLILTDPVANRNLFKNLKFLNE